MKKKNYFSGFNACKAFAILALSGALLTGCYKDDGLDVNGEVGQVVLPAATYTINGSVIDGSTGAAINNATVTVTPSSALKTNAGSFTATVQPGDVTINVTAPDYAAVTKVVTINAIEAGQAAVYSQIIPMVSTITAPESRIVDFDVTVDAFLEDDKTPFADCKAELWNAAGTAVVPMTNVAAGVYKLIVTPTDLTTYEAYTSIVTLDEVVVPADFVGNLKRNFVVYISKVATPEEPIAKTTFSCSFINGNSNIPFNVTSAQLTVNGAVQVTSASASTISYTLPTSDVKDQEFAVVYTYKNALGSTLTGRAVYAEGETSLSIVIDSHKKSDIWQTGVRKGAVTPGATFYENTEVVVLPGTNATLDGKALTQPISLERDYELEVVDPATLIAFTGLPSGTQFSTPLQIIFADVWGGQLGKLDMSYLENGAWTVDANGGSVTEAASAYTMNVAHFSIFRADVAMTDAVASSVEEETTTFPVDKVNELESQISVFVQYSTLAGSEFSTSVADAVAAAGFTNAAAASVVTDMINAYLLSKGIANTGITSSVAKHEVVIGGQTLFVSFDRVYTFALDNYTFTVGGKEVKLAVKTAVKTEINNIVTEAISHGHGHDHGHGHGNGNLAGGGIIDAE